MRIYQTLLKSISFCIFLAFLFVCLRIAFILYIGVFNNAMGDASFADILNALFNGAKYDNRNVGIVGILFLLIGLLSAFFRCQKTILNIYAGVIFFICIFVGIGNMLFYMIYGDVYHSALLGLLYDDQKAIILTGLKGEYSVITKIIICIVATFLSLYVYKEFCKFIEWIFIKKLPSLPKHSIVSSLGAFIILALILLVFINSRLALKEDILDMHAKLAQNSFLRKITPGSFRNLYTIYKGYKLNSNHVFKEPPIEITKEFFNLPADTKPPFDLYQLLEHTSTNTDKAPQIKQIFYIVSESFSDWYFDKEFDEIGVTSGLKSLIDGKHGLKIEHFLENAPATAKSLDVQTTGLFIADLDGGGESQIIAHPSLQTAIGYITKKLGYETRFYFGGNYVWRQLDRICAAEGFDEMFANADLSKYAAQKGGYPKSIENTWGVSDDVLFDFLLDNTPENSPTFNMVMTTSLHDPYDIDLKYYNVPVEKIDKFLKAHIPENEIHKPGLTKVVAHAWWYDKQITHFIKEASKRFPQSLFVITADHYGRIYARNHTDARIDKTAPLILYSPVLTPKQLYTIGSHLDIGATIVELVAPKDFKYVSFGKPLFSNNYSNKFHQDAYTLGYGAVATSRFIYTPDRGIEYFEGSKSKPDDKQEAQTLYKKLEDANILSSWILQKGNIVK